MRFNNDWITGYTEDDLAHAREVMQKCNSQDSYPITVDSVASSLLLKQIAAMKCEHFIPETGRCKFFYSMLEGKQMQCPKTPANECSNILVVED
jgi:hypothetical protein